MNIATDNKLCEFLTLESNNWTSFSTLLRVINFLTADHVCIPGPVLSGCWASRIRSNWCSETCNSYSFTINSYIHATHVHVFVLL